MSTARCSDQTLRRVCAKQPVENCQIMRTVRQGARRFYGRCGERSRRAAEHAEHLINVHGNEQFVINDDDAQACELWILKFG